MAYAISNGMKITIDKSGRIVVPKPLRDRFGLKPDMELDVLEQANGLLLRVPEQRPAMTKVKGLWVHQGAASAATDWDRVLENVREERMQTLRSV